MRSSKTTIVARLLACLCLVVAAIPMLLSAAALYPAVGAPVLFVQERVGRHRRIFCLRKLRTMRDLRDGGGQPLPDRERTPFVGGLVRRFRLDEIPQLLSVVKGDMAFVGPRPLLPETIASFGALGVRRCSVCPGLTGWAQVNGGPLLSDEDKLCLDLWYVDHASRWLDLRILFATVRILLLDDRIDPARVTEARTYLAMQA